MHGLPDRQHQRIGRDHLCVRCGLRELRIGLVPGLQRCVPGGGQRGRDERGRGVSTAGSPGVTAVSRPDRIEPGHVAVGYAPARQRARLAATARPASRAAVRDGVRGGGRRRAGGEGDGARRVRTPARVAERRPLAAARRCVWVFLARSVPCWLVQPGAGGQLHAVPEQQLQCRERVDVHLQRGLLHERHWRLSNLLEYVCARTTAETGFVVAVGRIAHWRMPRRGVCIAWHPPPVCPANTYDTSTGAASCTACPAGSTSVAGSTTCTCSAGYSSSGSGTSLVCTGTRERRCSSTGDELRRPQWRGIDEGRVCVCGCVALDGGAVSRSVLRGQLQQQWHDVHR